ncbi:phage integrase [gamma proteobacterium HdN1]|nr:Phage integrase, probably fragment [gamma proteobacterium HdN1]CBL47077.1 phage integrase [gamma proteobacterium HdN1]
MTLTELAQHYIDRHVFNEITAQGYRTAARVLERTLPKKSASDITTDELLLWRKQLLGKVSVNSFNTYARHLRIIFAHAEKNGLIASNPIAELKPIKRLQKPKHVAYDDIQRVLRQLESGQLVRDGWFWAILVRFLLSTGIRRRQLVNLKWGHLDFERKTILLTQAGSKNTLEWRIPMMASTAYDLMVLKERFENLGTKITSTMQVFNCTLLRNRRWKHTELKPHMVTTFFWQISKATNIKIGAHRLRHTLGTRLGTADDANLLVIQQLLGHASLTSTQVYVHCSIGQARKVLERDGFEYFNRNKQELENN